MTGEIRIVVADDHVLAREGMRRLFAGSDAMDVVAEAVDGLETLDVVERLDPDVLVLDVRMPNLNGIEVTRRLRGGHSARTRILVVSAYSLDEYVLAVTEAGADGYMMKTASPGELLDAVTRVHGGEFVLHPVVARQMAELWARRRIVEEELGEKLTTRELQVVQLAAQGMRNRGIAAELGISTRSVEARFRAVFSKLGVSSRVQAILYAVSNNLVATGRDD